MSSGVITYWRGQSFYLNITNDCPNNCIFCVRRYQSGVYGFNLSLSHDPSEKAIWKAMQEHLRPDFQEVVFTGFGEPLTRLPVVCHLSQRLKKEFPVTIRIDTNGLVELLYPETNVINRLEKAGVDELSISLNASNTENYLTICRPKFGLKSFNALLDFAKKAKKSFSVRFTVVDIPQVNKSECFKLAREFAIPLKVRSYSGPPLALSSR